MECVEVRLARRSVLVRNSRDTALVLRFTPATWSSFVAGAKHGEFD